MHISFSDEAPDTADDSDEDLITSYIPGVGMSNKPGHPIIRIGSPTAGNGILSDDRPILGEYKYRVLDLCCVRNLDSKLKKKC